MATLEGELDMWWCMYDTWRCTYAEALSLWLIAFFPMFLVIVTGIHVCIQSGSGAEAINEEATRRHSQIEDTSSPTHAAALMLYILALFSGIVLWIVKGVEWVHPVQNTPVQMVGVAMLVACYIGFVYVHVAMGKNWSPQPEVKAQHKLVVHGPFRVARHPMYAIFLWFGVASSLATLNWLIGLFGFSGFLLAVSRIPCEERILVDLFGDEYKRYQGQVCALGPPWWCFTFGSRSSRASASADYCLLAA